MLEEIEKLEQLRALAAGLTIGVGVVKDARAASTRQRTQSGRRPELGGKTHLRNRVQ
jgi:CMP-2-keto-3-deoxyoctulosonic acid synthetase